MTSLFEVSIIEIEKGRTAGGNDVDLQAVKKYLPEYQEVLKASGGYKPRLFVKSIKVVKCPASFNPSAQGDFAFTHAFVYSVEKKRLTEGPFYSYDTMLSSRINPYEREVDVPEGSRAWVVTYDGQWGGYWSKVLVFISSSVKELEA